FVTHSHIDHIGRIAKLVKDGFNGVIYSTIPSRDIAEIMLKDSLKVFGMGTGERKLPPLYGKRDVEKTMSLWKTLSYGEEVVVVGGFKVRLRNSGHVLGSSMVEVVYNGKKIVFTGDLGGSNDPILRDTEIVKDADYLVMESVYGDRVHEDVNERRRKLKSIIEETVSKKGVLMIPAFSLERTQHVLFDLNELVESSKIPVMPIFLDSPLAIKLTEVYEKYTDFFNDKAKAIIASGDDIFKFTNLHMTLTPEESIAISRSVNPKIIIAGSGMSTGGRIIFHEKKYLSNPNNTLLMVGYQAAGTPGREIQEGAKKVTLRKEGISVNARIEMITSYSAHKDTDELLDFVASSADTLKKVFVVMGEPSTALYFSQRIKDYTGVQAIAPEEGQQVELEF
ncbi:MAG TPA: MBL fold metallo-hydrolase, partial [Candidatus Yonathbacteria bacterium]|nr:MBL fold metallo-hydrolase [Candidatus Yonathbacteria bacterium]